MLITIFLITGCDVKYEVDLTKDNSYYEKTEIEENNLTTDAYSIMRNYNDFVYAIYSDRVTDLEEKDPNFEYYNIINNSNETKGFITLSYTFNNQNIEKSNIIKTCYDNITFLNNAKDINIKTSSKFLCFEEYPDLKNVEIVIKTDKTIINHNADKVEGNTYIWNITKENANNKEIKLSSLKESITDNDIDNEDNLNPEKRNNLILILGLLGLFFIILIILLKIRRI